MRRASIIVLTLALAACQAPGGGANDVLRVASTTSFGMCVGYCKTSLVLTPQKAVLTSEPSGRGMSADAKPKSVEKPLSPAQWRDIAELAAAATIDALPDVIGCPDCADGGAESLTIEKEGSSKTITFDHGADIREAAPLLAMVRALRAEIAPAE